MAFYYYCYYYNPHEINGGISIIKNKEVKFEEYLAENNNGNSKVNIIKEFIFNTSLVESTGRMIQQLFQRL